MSDPHPVSDPARPQRSEAAYQERISRYAAKYAAETVSAEPPEWVEPTHRNIEKLLSGCVRPPAEDELHDIQVEFFATYSHGGYGPQLPERRLTYYAADGDNGT